MRAGMSKYKKAPSSTSGRFGQSSSGLPPVPGVPAQQQPGPTNMGGNQPNMGGNQPNMAGNMMSQHGMGPQGRMPHQQPGKISNNLVFGESTLYSLHRIQGDVFIVLFCYCSI